jgi:hypothetical protein
VLNSYADYAVGFDQIKCEKSDETITDLAKKYNAVIAKPIEKQFFAESGGGYHGNE